MHPLLAPSQSKVIWWRSCPCRSIWLYSDSDRAQEVIAAYPEIQHWAVGGHSLGGAMAARFVYQHPGAIQGLALWAAYPASSDDLQGNLCRLSP